MKDSEEIRRYILITQLDPLYTYHFFNELIFLIKNNNFWDDKKIYIYDLPSFNESKLKTFFRFYNLYQAKDTTKLIFKYFYFKYLKNRLGMLNKSFSEINVYFNKLDSVNTSNFKKILSEEPSNVISISAPQIFSKEILSTSICKFYNIHCAPLPAYKGMMPNFWQRYHNEQSTSVVLHEMNEKIDQGEILKKITYPLPNSISLHQIMINGKLFSAHLFNQFFTNYKKEENLFTKGSYFSFPFKNDAEIFRKRGGKFF